MGIENHQKIASRYSEIYENIVSLRDKGSFLSLVDCACGRGEVCEHFLENSKFDVIGYDIDPNKVALCKQKGIPSSNNDICSLPLSDNSIDIFVSSETLEHLEFERFRTATTEIDRVLRPGGLLVITAPSTKQATFAGRQKHIHKLYVSNRLIMESFPVYKILSDYIIYKNNKSMRMNSGNRIIILEKIDRSLNNDKC